MPNFKKLALIATEIKGKTSAETAGMAEMADTATEPKTIPPVVFQKWVGRNKLEMMMLV